MTVSLTIHASGTTAQVETLVQTSVAVTAPAPRSRRVRSMLATFSSGHGWSKQSASGTQTSDSSIVAVGDGSLKLVTTDTNTVISRKTSIGPFDLTGRDIIVWFRLDDPSTLSELSIYLSSNNFSSAYISKNLDSAGAQRPYMVAGEWVGVTIPQGEMTVTGTPDLTAINSLQVRFKATASGAVAYVGGIGLVERPASGVVSIAFDDGKDDQFTTALPVLSKYGLPATTYVICDRIDQPSFLSLSQLQSLQSLHGWEVAFHAYTLASHEAKFNNLTEAETAADFVSGKAWLRDNGFGNGANHFAYPGGAYNAETLALARKHFTSARTIAENVQETFPPADPTRLRMYNCLNTRSAANVTAEIDKAIANKTWLILVFHRIVASGQDDESTEFPVDDLTTVAAYLRSSGAIVRTVGDVMANGI